MAVGDLGFVGDVRPRMSADPSYPFSDLRGLFSAADVVLGNLEIPLLDGGKSSRNPVIPSTLVAPVEAAARMAGSGFSALVLANNHVMDHGPEGLRSTIAAVDGQGLARVGAGETLAAARTPLVLERKGRKIGILAYTSSSSTWADVDRPGAAPMRDDIVEADLRSLRDRVDLVVLSLHFGLMYTDFPQLADQARLRRYVDLGADVIVGHHPHVCQGIEIYKDRPIAYSLGEILFDPRAGNVLARNSLLLRRDTFVFRCRISADRRVSSDYIPVEIGDDLAPRVANGDAALRIRARIDALSAPLAGDGLERIDVAGLAGERLSGHELRVLWHHLKRGHVRYVVGKLVRIRPRHVRMGWRTMVRKLGNGP
jgi:poly-gamma-glutamate synthesis protein (capsule biosynthesis protein)